MLSLLGAMASAPTACVSDAFERGDQIPCAQDATVENALFYFVGPALRHGFSGEMNDGIGIAQGIGRRLPFRWIPDGKPYITG